MSDLQINSAIYLDDFWDWMTNAGKKVYEGVKNIYVNNKDDIHSLIKQIIPQLVPTQYKPLAAVAMKAFGGTLYSEDPYAISKGYLSCIFSDNPLQ